MLFRTLAICVSVHHVAGFGGAGDATSPTSPAVHCEPDTECLSEGVTVPDVDSEMHEELHMITQRALGNLEVRLKSEGDHEAWADINTELFHMGLDGTENLDELVKVIRPYGDEHSPLPHIDYYLEDEHGSHAHTHVDYNEGGRRLLQEVKGGGLVGFSPDCSGVPWGGAGKYCILGDIWWCDNQNENQPNKVESCGSCGCSVAPRGQEDYCKSEWGCWDPNQPTPRPTPRPPTPRPTSPNFRLCCSDSECYDTEMCNYDYYKYSGVCNSGCEPRTYCKANSECPYGQVCAGTKSNAPNSNYKNPSYGTLDKCTPSQNVMVCPLGNAWEGSGQYCFRGNLWWCSEPGVQTDDIYETCGNNGCTSDYNGAYCVDNKVGGETCNTDYDCGYQEECVQNFNSPRGGGGGNYYSYCQKKEYCTSDSECAYNQICRPNNGRRLMQTSATKTVETVEVTLYGGGGFGSDFGCVENVQYKYCPSGSYFSGPGNYCIDLNLYYCSYAGEAVTDPAEVCPLRGCIQASPRNAYCDYGSSASMCTFDYDCSYPDTCRNGYCNTEQPTNNDDMFYGPYYDFAVKGSNDRIIDAPQCRNQQECADLCINERTFYCASYEYNQQGQKCVLSKSVYPTVQAGGWNLYIRI